MFEDQRFGGGNDVARQRQPIEMWDGDQAAGDENPGNFLRCFRPVEPMPALSRCDRVHAGSGKTGVFGAGFAIVDRNSGLGIELAGLFQHGRRRINASDGGTTGGKLARQRAGTGAEVYEALP